MTRETVEEKIEGLKAAGGYYDVNVWETGGLPALSDEQTASVTTNPGGSAATSSIARRLQKFKEEVKMVYAVISWENFQTLRRGFSRNIVVVEGKIIANIPAGIERKRYATRVMKNSIRSFIQREKSNKTLAFSDVNVHFG